jgi:hypothetical protein
VVHFELLATLAQESAQKKSTKADGIGIGDTLFACTNQSIIRSSMFIPSSQDRILVTFQPPHFTINTRTFISRVGANYPIDNLRHRRR